MMGTSRAQAMRQPGVHLSWVGHQGVQPAAEQHVEEEACREQCVRFGFEQGRTKRRQPWNHCNSMQKRKPVAQGE